MNKITHGQSVRQTVLPRRQAGFITSFDDQLLYSQQYQNADHPQHSLVLLHGMGGDLNFIRPFIDYLMDNYRSLSCITYDARGHGLSTNSFACDQPQMEDISARDLQAVCQYYQLDQPSIVGHSFGGMTVQHYANLNLEPKPHQLFLLNSPLSTPPIGINRQFWFHQLQRSKSQTSANRSVASHLKFIYSHDLDPVRIYHDLKTTGFNQWLLLYLSTLGWKNLTPEKINHQQTSIILGAKDFLLRSGARRKILGTLNQTHHYLLNTNHHQAYLATQKQLAQIIASRLTLQPSKS